MTIVGLRPVHIVTIEPYSSVHCLSLYQGFLRGSAHLFPRIGIGKGPGGLNMLLVTRNKRWAVIPTSSNYAGNPW